MQPEISFSFILYNSSKYSDANCNYSHYSSFPVTDLNTAITSLTLWPFFSFSLPSSFMALFFIWSFFFSSWITTILLIQIHTATHWLDYEVVNGRAVFVTLNYFCCSVAAVLDWILMLPVSGSSATASSASPQNALEMWSNHCPGHTSVLHSIIHLLSYLWGALQQQVCFEFSLSLGP